MRKYCCLAPTSKFLFAIVLWQRAVAFNVFPRPRSLAAITKFNSRNVQSPVKFHGIPHSSSNSLRPHYSSLGSLKKLVEQVNKDVNRSGSPRTIFVGGKGGVGKTTISSALAVTLTLGNPDLRVLVVSTDPAHSLGDALDEDLRSSSSKKGQQARQTPQRQRGQTVVMTDPLTGGRLWACEVDAVAALDEFRENLSAFDVVRLADALGVSISLLENLGLEQFSGLLQNPPPGLDELVALSNVLDRDDDEFDVIVVDTAPTGHTLRLLALPQFLDGLLGKLIALRAKLSALASTLQAFFGNEQAKQRAQILDQAVVRLEKFRAKMTRLRKRLTDSVATNFVVVTVPTKLGVAETKRLVSELRQQKVAVTDVVVNQCVSGSALLSGDDSASKNYYNRRLAGQKKWISKLTEAVAEVSRSKEYQSIGGSSNSPIAMTTIPLLDVEPVGIPALAYVGSQAFAENPAFAHVINEEDRSQRVVICGGKGGVGKTTTSASLAISMAAKGHNVALISTDPAHSLGDAIDMNLVGGNLIECPLIGMPSSGQGSLSVLEIDPSSALKEFQGTVDKLVGEVGDSGEGIGKTLREIQEVFDTLPAGTDEVVALAKIINLVKKGGFDRIVLDTAPTGHTLRMLSTPGFLSELIERLLRISEKINSNSMVRMLISSSGRGPDIEMAAEQAKSSLLKFQLRMYDLEDLFSDPDRTEFLIVTVPTELAVRESMRLLNDLTCVGVVDDDDDSTDDSVPIQVRNVVVNQVLRDDGTDAQTFLSHVNRSQQSSLQELERMVSTLQPQPPEITQVPFLDTEPRGVFALKVLADSFLRADE